ncbi:Protein of unknown function [Natronincola peptidivorans]|uniref:DUF1659 domain-containing protein n=1 Tax=Natronincola peptidivorans TaxID=426128 RepID=A0A1I0FKD2_9FIRM|nr:DUF1659 domain-containing protein [Natronincola peptidivorans]SET58510.1 Protein of unknown function [Natronincola peptidivorans]
MPVTKFNESKYASVRFITETDLNGNHKYSTRRVANMKPTATLTAMYNTAASVIGLSKFQAETVVGTEQYQIVES